MVVYNGLHYRTNDIKNNPLSTTLVYDSQGFDLILMGHTVVLKCRPAMLKRLTAVIRGRFIVLQGLTKCIQDTCGLLSRQVSLSLVN